MLQTYHQHFTTFTFEIDLQQTVIINIFNYDLKKRAGDNQRLYGIIISCDDHNWRFDDILTSKQIKEKYDVEPHELPKSSRDQASFKRQLAKPIIIENIIHDTDWCNIRINKGIHTSQDAAKLTISKDEWIQECKKSMEDKDKSPLIPIIVAGDDNNYEIAWIKIIYIESYDIYVGLQFGYDQKEYLLTSLWLKRESPGGLSEDLIILLTQFCVALKVNSICVSPEYVYDGHKAVTALSNASFDDIENNGKWVTDVEIFDFANDIKQMSNDYDIDYVKVEQCIDENDLNYEFIQNHTRRDFIQILRPYGIKVGEAFYIWTELNKHIEDRGVGVEIIKSNHANEGDLKEFDDLFYFIVCDDNSKC